MPGAFVHDAPVPRVIFGAGALSCVPDEVRALGCPAMLIAGRHAGRSADEVAAALGDEATSRIRDVAEHVPSDVATAAVAQARADRVGVVASIGGGSATGLAKAVARETGLPILAVPTTYAGSEMTPIWGMTDADGKTTGRHPAVLPRTIVYDPELTLSLPGDVAAASGMNALAHCVEGLYAADTSPVTSLLAEEGIRRLAAALPAVVSEPQAIEPRSDALYGAWLAGWVLGSATMGLHHKLAHVLGGNFRLPHGGVHSALLPHVAAFNADAASDAMGRVSSALGAEGPADAGRALFELALAVGAPTSLSALGLSIDAVEDVAAAVAEAGAANPRRVDEDAVRTLLLNAYAGRCPQEYQLP